MRRLLLALTIACAPMVTPALAADVGVSINVGQPGFYGQIDIGNYPRPQLIYRQPVIIEPVRTIRAPIYLHVPPGHAKNWSKHCRKYNACGERVYFVQDSWYNQQYVPRYQKKHYKDKDKHRDNEQYGKHKDKYDKKDKDDRDNGNGRNH